MEMCMMVIGTMIRSMGNKGVYKYSDGDVYDGDWDDGYKHGKGIFNYAN